MSYVYSLLLDELDYELEQEKESPDTAKSDAFRVLPRTAAPHIINEVLKSLVKKNPALYKQELILSFYDSTTDHYPLIDGEYFYIDINESVSGNILTIPDRIKEITAFMVPGSYSDSTMQDGLWGILNDNSGAMYDIYAKSRKKIYNADGWNDGDVLKVIAVVYPEEIKNDIAAVVISSLTLNDDDSIDLVTSSKLSGIVRGDVLTISLSDPSAFDGTYTVTHIDETAISLIPYEATPSGVFVFGRIGFVSDDVEVGIEDDFTRLLKLEIKKIAFSRKNKPMSSFEYIELVNERRPEWVMAAGKLNTIGTINAGGIPFGRER